MSARGSRSPLAVVGGAVLLALSMLGDLATLDQPWPLAVFSLVTSLALVAVWLERRPWAIAAASASVVATIGLHLAGGVWSYSLTEGLALLILLAHRMRRSEGGRNVLVTAMVAVAGVLLPSRIPEVPWEFFVAGAVLSLSTIGVGSALRAHDRRRRRAIDLTRLGERELISRELHDIVAHHVTGILVTAQAALLDDDPLTARRALVAIEHAGGVALGATRELVTTLREHDSALGVPLATVHDVGVVVKRFRDSGSTAAVTATLPAAFPDATIATTVHRVVQESLTNVRRYAFGAERLDVAIAVSGSETTVVVTDTGGATYTDPDEFPRSRLGILGMRERVEALGGRLEAGPVDGAGWRVLATLPHAPVGGSPEASDP